LACAADDLSVLVLDAIRLGGRTSEQQAGDNGGKEIFHGRFHSFIPHNAGLTGAPFLRVRVERRVRAPCKRERQL
jgi:hypothetical protein